MITDLVTRFVHTIKIHIMYMYIAQVILRASKRCIYQLTNLK